LSNLELDINWVNSQVSEFSEHRPRYIDFDSLLKALFQQAIGEMAMSAIVQTRVKKIQSFTEKIIRQRDEFHDPNRQFTDLVGVRVIVHTTDQLEPVCNFIESTFRIDWENTVHPGARLKANEFGYRSIHYIVMIDPDKLIEKGYLLDIPESVLPDKKCPMRAEVQVRTILEHAWSVFSHMHAYKGKFKTPDVYKRELAGVAALFESADATLSRIRRDLLEYTANYDTYLSDDEIRAEIKLNEIILAQDPMNTTIAHRIGQLAIFIGDWNKAIEILSKYEDSSYEPIIRDLGIALGKKYKKEIESEGYRRGQQLLQKAVEYNSSDVDALSSLAGTWKGIDDERARKYYKMAFDAQPDNSYVLGNFIEYELLRKNDPSIIKLISAVLIDAIARCHKQAEVGMNIPWAFYDAGKFLLMLEDYYESLNEHLRAATASNALFMIETSMNSLMRLQPIIGDLEGYAWVINLLELFRNVKFGTELTDVLIGPHAPGDLPRITKPIVIITGSTKVGSYEFIEGYKDKILEAFDQFEGTIISGGTFSGVCRLAGDIKETFRDKIHLVGYIPSDMPANVKIDDRYDELRETQDKTFSPMQVLQYWYDIVASGVKVHSTAILGFGGGSISDFEYGLAAGLGAKVGVITESGWGDRWNLVSWSEKCDHPIKMVSVLNSETSQHLGKKPEEMYY